MKKKGKFIYNRYIIIFQEGPFLIQLKSLLSILFLILSMSLTSYGLAEPPSDTSNNAEDSAIDEPITDTNTETNNTNESYSVADEFMAYDDDYENENSIDKVFDISEEQAYELSKNYKKAMKKNRLETAAGILKELPQHYHTKKQQEAYKHFLIYEKVTKEIEEESADFFKEEDLDPKTQKAIKRLIKEAKISFINNEPETAKRFADSSFIST